MRELSVYNLEFPDYVTSLSLGDYKFRRVKDYSKAFAGLQHLVNSVGGEFLTNFNTGSHQITAIVEIPDKEKNATLPWEKNNDYTQLYDILLLLSLFVGRNIFVLNEGEEGYPLRPDPRGHFYGGQFQLSAIQDTRWQNKNTGELISEDEMKGKPVYEYNYLNIGLEKTINEVLVTISSNEWKEKFNGGYFLFLFRQAMKQHDVEPAFLLCWSIWEHLFAIHNEKWLDKPAIEQMSGDKKISFILNKYLLIDIDEGARKEVKRIAQARNRLVHFGMKPENVDYREMELLIRLTEQIVAITLNLEPSNAFNSIDEIKKLLKNRK